MSSANVFTTVVCPLFGMILANIMWWSPFKIVMQARESRDLKDLNPFTFIATIFNCIGWMTFGILTRDHFMFWANVTGLLLGTFYSVSCLGLLFSGNPKGKLSISYYQLEGAFLFVFLFWSIMGLVASVGFTQYSDPLQQAANLFGTLSCACSIGYYAAPLTSMIDIISKRDASSIYLPTTIVNLVNALLWFMYGLGIGNLNVWLPNGLGALLSIGQISLIFLFKSRPSQSIPVSKEELYDAGEIESNNPQVKNISAKSNDQEVMFADILDEELLDRLQNSETFSKEDYIKNPVLTKN